MKAAKAALRRHKYALSWILAILCFGLGSWIGWTRNPNLGAVLWVASAFIALLPFMSHRDF